jgi:hypothetical protein
VLRQGRYTDAEPLLRDGLSRMDSLSPRHWARFALQSMLGEALTGQGRFAEAEPLLLEAVEGLRKAAGVPDGHKRDGFARTVDLYERWGNAQAADEWRKQAADNGVDLSGLASGG